MPQKIIRKILIAGALISVIWLCWQIAVNVLLAGWLETTVIPRAARQAGLEQASVSISRLGLFETEIGPVVLGNPDRPFLEVAAIKARYTPWGLARGHVNTVTVHGVSVNAQYTDGAITFPGFAPVAPEKAPAAEGASLPVSMDAVKISGAMVNLLTESQRFQVPCDLKLTSSDGTMETIDAVLDLYPCGQQITVTARAMLNQGELFATLNAPALVLERFAGWSSLVPGLHLAGSASVAGRAHIRLNPAALASGSVRFEMTKGEAGYQNVVLGPAGSDAPLAVTVAGSQASGWQLTGANIKFVSPASLALEKITGSLQAGPEADKKQGSFSIAAAPSAPDPQAPFLLDGPLTLAGTFSGRTDKNGWQFDLTAGRDKTDNKKSCRIRMGNALVALPVPDIQVSGNGTADRGWAECVLTASGAAITLNEGTITVADAKISGTADFSTAAGQAMSAKGDLGLALGRIRADRHQVRVEKTDIHLPWQWPEGSAPRGSLTVGPVKWKNLNMGELSGALQQKGQGLTLNARYGKGVISGLSGTLNASASVEGSGGPAMDMKLSLGHRNTAPDIDPGLFAPDAAGSLVNGNLDLTANFSLHDEETTGLLHCRLDAGSFRMPEKKAAITGIDGNLTFPDLPRFKSSPDQKVVFREAVFGDIHMADGKIDLQLESGPTLFIEKSSFNWCRGTVYTEGLRIAPGQTSYDLTLYADRLNLADVLGQMGAVAAEGEGTVSGRIPILYTGGDITIDNGFLFSAPGEGGIIHLSRADMLTAGLPEASAQYRQIDLAREALKNYQYDWAKVLLNSEGENLSVKLQFDGKPTRSLPFVYDKNTGGFVRVTDQRKYSEFKGLSLDVNFRIPINQLIGYKDIWNLNP